jgi:uncharacterized membrane protein
MRDGDRSVADQFEKIAPVIVPWFKKPWVWLVGAFAVLCLAAYFLA